MVDNRVRYESKSVKTLRGTEGRSIAKWQQQGWELVSQDAATLHTTLNFRKVKPPLPVRQLVIGGVVVAVLLGILGVGAALEGGGDSEEVPAARATPRPVATATPEATAEVVPEATAAAPTATSAEPPDGPLADTTVDALYDRLNAANIGGIRAGDRFRLTGELFSEESWGVSATGEYSVYLQAKAGTNDLLVFVDQALTAGWRNGTRVQMVVKAVERTINGETTDGWLQAQSVKLL